MSPIEKVFSNQTILVIDPSASHLGYALVDLNLSAQTAEIMRYGMVWTKPSWSKGQRFTYVQAAIKRLLETEPFAKAVYTESFFVNPKQMFGSSVIPTINGIIEMTAYQVSKAGTSTVEYREIPPPAWRATLGIKPDITVLPTGKKSRDYKEPTKREVERMLGALPTMIKSNINQRERSMPYDVFDVLAIALSICKTSDIQTVSVNHLATMSFDLFNPLRDLED